MDTFPQPLNEANRQHAVYESCLLRMPASKNISRSIMVLAERFDVPMAMFSVIDKQHEVTVATHGLDASSIPRKDSFCAYTIMQGRILRVADCNRDRRFRQTAELLGDPAIHFYAGAPVRCGDFPIGALSILDTRARNDLKATSLGFLQSAAENLSDLIQNSATAFALGDFADPSEQLIDCHISSRKNGLLVRLTGEATANHILSGLCERILSAIDIHNTESVTLDLRHCNMARGSCVGTLLRIFKECHQHQIRFSLLNVNPAIETILTRMKLSDLVIE